MGLKIIEDNLDAVDAAFHSLYTEKDGKFTLTGVDGMKTDLDVSRIQTALVKERNDHKGTKEKYAILGQHDPVEILALLDRIPGLEEAAKGTLDDAKIDSIVETRIKAKMLPLERLLETEKTRAANLEAINKNYVEKEKTSSIHSAVRKAALDAKVRPEAIDDAITLAERFFEITDSGDVIAKETVGILQGIDPATWLTELQSKKPHWWGETIGGGSQGSGSNFGSNINPWSGKDWNLTEQGKIYMKNPAKAEQLAASAGTTVGGRKPSK
jgi:hypothetical protein